jgi:hypothetical protein
MKIILHFENILVVWGEKFYYSTECHFCKHHGNCLGPDGQYTLCTITSKLVNDGEEV